MSAGQATAARLRARYVGAAGAWPTRLDRPWVVALAAVVAGALVAAARLAVLAHGNPSWFIVAGNRFAKPGALPYPIHLFAGGGYDGTFYYRLALDPARLARTAFGITFDNSYRVQRIGYPALAWLLAGGRGLLVPWTLIAVNVIALGALGLAGGALARDSGRHALAGLLLVGYWGYPFSLSRDTAEIPAAALTMGALLALRRRRPWWAAVLFGAAVLTRETTLVVVAAVALHHLWVRIRRERTSRYPGWSAYASWLVPGAVFVGWQLVVRTAIGRLPSTSDAASNLGPPFVAVVTAVHRDLATIARAGSELDIVELAVLATVSVLALRSLAGSSAPGREKLAWVLLTVLVVCLATTDWASQANQRSLDQFYLLGALLLLGSRRRLILPGMLVGATWLAVAGHAVLFV